jgi:hypothetical protein
VETRRRSIRQLEAASNRRIQNQAPVATADPSVDARSVTGVTGRLSWSDCQWAPSSKETQSPNSVRREAPADRGPPGRPG